MEKTQKIILMIIIAIFSLFLYATNSEASLTTINYNFDTGEKTTQVKEDENSEVQGTIFIPSEEVKQEQYNLGNERLESTTAKDYYYNQLSTEAKADYNELNKKLTAGEKVKLEINSDYFDCTEATLEQDVRTYSNFYVLTHITDAIRACLKDHPEMYWLHSFNIQYEYGTIENKTKVRIITVSLGFDDEIISGQETFDKNLEEAVNEIEGDTFYKKIKSMHDYVCKTVTYQELDGTEVEQSAYGALVNRVAVCEGQSALFKLLCDKIGIECLIIEGYSQSNNVGGHAWNYVYAPTEEKWYAVDTTWDNDKNNELDTDYYILVGGKTECDGVIFENNHRPGFKSYTMQTFYPATPTLAEEKYEVFAGTINRSTKEKTNEDVTVTISTTMPIVNEIEGWSKSEDGLTLTKVFTKNATEEIEVKNRRDETLRGTITIDYIDKEKPILNIEYQKDANGITVVITSNEKVQSINGWSLSEDALVLKRKYYSNIDTKLEIKDEAGNITEQEITITELTEGSQYNKGDVNKDSVIDMLDAIKTLRNIAYNNSDDVKIKHSDWNGTEEEQDLMDVDSNGTIEMADVIKILRHVAVLKSETVKSNHADWEIKY